MPTTAGASAGTRRRPPGTGRLCLDHSVHEIRIGFARCTGWLHPILSPLV